MLMSCSSPLNSSTTVISSSVVVPFEETGVGVSNAGEAVRVFFFATTRFAFFATLATLRREAFAIFLVFLATIELF
jgi:hypothetical protein